MRRFLLDTGIASDYLNRRRGVFERAREQVSRGNRIGIAVSVLAELHFGIELSASRDENLRRLVRALPSLRPGSCAGPDGRELGHALNDAPATIDGRSAGSGGRAGAGEGAGRVPRGVACAAGVA